MKRTRLHVTPNGDHWSLKQENIPFAMGAFQTQQQAIQAGQNQLRYGFGQLLIHGTDGKIREERTYPKSSDPHRFPG